MNVSTAGLENRILNETDVREEIAVPFLDSLGYRGGTVNEIVREMPLSYNRDFLGRKKKADPPLRGRADYVLRVLGVGRWVLEIKSPSEEITKDVVDQALSYARHPEISGFYAAILNGKHFVVYHNTQSSDEKPLLDIPVVTPQDLAQKLMGLLSPSAIRRDLRKPIIDLGDPLADGLRSECPIISGVISYSKFTSESNFPIPVPQKLFLDKHLEMMSSIIGTITGGEIWRDSDSAIRAKLKWAAPHQDSKQFMFDKKLEDAEYISLDKIISSDPERPTIFDVVDSISVEKGERIFNPINWETQAVGIGMLLRYQAQATGYIQGDLFAGDMQVEYKSTFPALPGAVLIMRGIGSFEIKLDNR